MSKVIGYVFMNVKYFYAEGAKVEISSDRVTDETALRWLRKDCEVRAVRSEYTTEPDQILLGE